MMKISNAIRRFFGLPEKNDIDYWRRFPYPPALPDLLPQAKESLGLFFPKKTVILSFAPGVEYARARRSKETILPPKMDIIE